MLAYILRLYERHVVCFDVQKRLAKWVAYKLTKDDIEGKSIIVSELTQFHLSYGMKISRRIHFVEEKTDAL